MALSANREVDRYVDQELREVPVAAGAHVFKGGFVEWSPAGYGRPVAGGGQLAGLAYEEMDNTGGADGAKRVRVFTQGDFVHALTGAGPADVGRSVYALDDGTLSFSPAGVFAGYVQAVEASGRIVLRLGGVGPVRTAAIAHFPASFALSARQSGLICTNFGATGAVVATLPQNAPAGTQFGFVCMADQAMQIAPGTGGGIYIKGLKQPDNKYVAISDIGDFVYLVADGNGDWVAVASIQGTEADLVVET